MRTLITNDIDTDIDTDGMTVEQLGTAMRAVSASLATGRGRITC